jgi:5'-3' exonuclease
LTTDDLQLNFANIGKLIHAISSDEEEGWASLDASFKRFAGYDNMTVQEEKIMPGTRGWIPRYYDVLLPRCNIDDVAAKYIRGLHWSWVYYTDYNDARLSDYYYPYAYSPTVVDLINRDIGNYVPETIDVGKVTLAAMRNPKLLLLLVLPPTSKYLLQDATLEAIMSSMSSLQHFYPNKFKIAKYARFHETLAILPDIDGLAVMKKLETWKKMMVPPK